MDGCRGGWIDTGSWLFSSFWTHPELCTGISCSLGGGEEPCLSSPMGGSPTPQLGLAQVHLQCTGAHSPHSLSWQGLQHPRPRPAGPPGLRAGEMQGPRAWAEVPRSLWVAQRGPTPLQQRSQLRECPQVLRPAHRRHSPGTSSSQISHVQTLVTCGATHVPAHPPQCGLCPRRT